MFSFLVQSSVVSSQSIILKKSLLAISATAMLAMTGCTPTPPDHRAQVLAPVYEGGDSLNGKKLYAEYCEQCHTLKPGSNKKGPQLVGVYMAPSGQLEDYKYSDAMSATDWTWDAETLDTYIADAEAALPNTRMLSDPLPEAEYRQDIIAYLSTLGRDPIPEPEQEK
ncbi:c-type cytochrome [Psychrobacter sp. FDAARGOS_221]|uniref:c-type cytochrome n=1 Tax=Psychrobacter sp. FDAARGOS_221 TaxID=1975705 RepID=UPI000BB570FA|nr:c-type cytochrome [Psychrobacter sp. FDAARGOS_221]PNK60273.1 cytochrome C [Psychrobacter sp. FDAARGOS_221]